MQDGLREDPERPGQRATAPDAAKSPDEAPSEEGADAASDLAMSVRRKTIAVQTFLVAAVLIVFGQTMFYEFVTFDDPTYVFANPHISAGVTLRGITWVFTHSHASNWHPLTSMSHMLDCQWYGLKPGGHHLTNVLLHCMVAALLFSLMKQMTGRLWPSAFVAAVFAIHPLRAESVAWVAERKDVLSGLFFVLTLMAYVRYARLPFSLRRYLAVLGLFILGLMCKPMLVTLPFVLLLLDYWPLERFGSGKAFGRPIKVLVLEKLPLLALAAASCLVTLVVQEHALSSIALPWRIANSIVSYASYVGEFFWPANLCILYPHPDFRLAISKVVVAAIVLAAISIGVLLLRRKHPYLLVGWLWYLGMLVPVIGVVQVGSQAMADRYTYLPQIGLCMGLTWLVVDLGRAWPHRAVLGGIVSVAIVATLMVCACRQTQSWRDSKTLWQRTIDCAQGNALAYNNMGVVLQKRGQFEEAVACYNKAIQISPLYDKPYYNLGRIAEKDHKTDEAVRYYRKALKINPDLWLAHNNLANNLLRQGKRDEAIEHFRLAVESDPDVPLARCSYGDALYGAGRDREALAQWREALLVLPNEAMLVNRVACILATDADASLRDGAKAVELAERARDLSHGKSAVVLDTLAAAYAENGQFASAVRTAEEALPLLAEAKKKAEAHAVQNFRKAVAGLWRDDANRKAADRIDNLYHAVVVLWFCDQNQQAEADAIGDRIELYRANKPCHQRILR